MLLRETVTAMSCVFIVLSSKMYIDVVNVMLAILLERTLKDSVRP